MKLNEFDPMMRKSLSMVNKTFLDARPMVVAHALGRAFFPREFVIRV